MPRVQLVCQFGQPVRGVSPYGDALLSSLSACRGLTVDPVDYRSAYPSALHPAGGYGAMDRGELHWADPRTWYRVAHKDADIVHLQYWMPPLASYLWPLVAMSRVAGKRIVITVHNPEPHEPSALFNTLEHRLLRAADTLIVHDARGEKVLEHKLTGRACDIRVIPHGVNIDIRVPRQAADYDMTCLVPERRYILMFGNLREYKGLEILLEAWRQIMDLLPDVDLVIAGRLWKGGDGVLSRVAAGMMGSGRYSRKVMDQLALFGSSTRVVVREGFVSDDKIDALLRVSELALFPYEIFASQSGAACRAAGSGCPVLVTDVGGLPDLAISRDWVIAPGSVEQLARRLLDRLSYGAVRDTFEADQRARIEKYGWKHVSQMHADVYRDLTGATTCD